MASPRVRRHAQLKWVTMPAVVGMSGLPRHESWDGFFSPEENRSPLASTRFNENRTLLRPRNLERAVRNIRDCNDKKYKGVITKEGQALPQHEMFFCNITSWGTLKLFPETGQRMVFGWNTHCSALLCWLRADTPHRCLVSSYSLCLGWYNSSNSSRQNMWLLDQHTNVSQISGFNLERGKLVCFYTGRVACQLFAQGNKHKFWFMRSCSLVWES